MTRNTAHSLAYLTSVAAAAIAASVVTSNAHAESPMTDNAPFASARTRADVQSELKLPFIGGNPWSMQYQLPARSSAVSREQVRGAYKMSREEVSALTSEDSGSAFLAKVRLTR